MHRRFRAFSFAMLLTAFAAGTAMAQQSGADALLNRFYGLREKDPAAARAAIEEAVRRYPQDSRVQLEIGYLTLAAGDKRRALAAFRAAVALIPARADLWSQIGYIENDLARPEAALAAFEESLRLEPGNDTVRTEIAYLQDRLGRKRAAARSFRAVIPSKDPKLASQACGAYSNLRAQPDKLLPNPFFAEYYLAPEYRTHFGVSVLPFDARAGASFGETTIVEPYVSFRLTRDSRSGNGTLGPQIFYDNALVAGLGLRVPPHGCIPFAVFGEGGAGFDMVARDRERGRDDVRGGVVGYWEWNTALACPPGTSFPFRPIFDIYGDGIYFTRYQNFIAYVRMRPGLRLFERPEVAIDAYALFAGTIDSLSLADNRQLEVGGGLALRLYELMGLTLRAEGVQVFRVRASGYTDFRFRIEHTIRF
jgi:tetratricopeptide (TPR) repeat protein